MTWQRRRPGLFAVVACALTVGIARAVSRFWPRAHVHLGPGLHLHHYVVGIFVLTAAGFLALAFKGSRATFWTAILYALGVGLTFDEFGLWFNPPFVRGVRWSYDGLLIVGCAFTAAAIVRIVVRRSRARGAEAAARPDR
jgi:hypothetical protein